MKEKEMNKEGFIPKHGGCRNLITYQKSEIIYDGTIHFTGRAFKKYDRTIDQMVQAARSGKQNIVEAGMASGTSKEMEIKLTNVASALHFFSFHSLSLLLTFSIKIISSRTINICVRHFNKTGLNSKVGV